MKVQIADLMQFRSSIASPVGNVCSVAGRKIGLPFWLWLRITGFFINIAAIAILHCDNHYCIATIPRISHFRSVSPISSEIREILLESDSIWVRQMKRLAGISGKFGPPSKLQSVAFQTNQVESSEKNQSKSLGNATLMNFPEDKFIFFWICHCQWIHVPYLNNYKAPFSLL